MNNYLEFYTKKQMIGLMVYLVIYSKDVVKQELNKNKKINNIKTFILLHLMDQQIQFTQKI